MLTWKYRRGGGTGLWLAVMSSACLAFDWTGSVVEAQSEARANRMGKITERQAVDLAESFVVQQGYTDLPADKGKAVRESFERGADTDSILRSRRNTLERKAFGIRAPADDSKSAGWLVIFKYRKHTGTGSTGRAVAMDGHGKGLRLIHQDILLTAATKTF